MGLRSGEQGGLVIYVGFVDEDKVFALSLAMNSLNSLNSCRLDLLPFLEGIFTRNPKLPYPGK
jgi:hypothetical protein